MVQVRGVVDDGGKGKGEGGGDLGEDGIGNWKRGCHKELFSFVWNVKGGSHTDLCPLVFVE